MRFSLHIAVRAVNLPGVDPSYLNRYVLDGGWVMLLLLPASVISLAVALRATWLLRESAVKEVAQALATEPGTEELSPSERAYHAALALYGMLQPLAVLVTLAPMVGLLGSLLIQYELTSAGSGRAAGGLLPRVLLPSIWGVAIGVFSHLAYALLRAKVFTAESEILLPELLRASGHPVHKAGSQAVERRRRI